jgi:hypothetical protein
MVAGGLEVVVTAVVVVPGFTVDWLVGAFSAGPQLARTKTPAPSVKNDRYFDILVFFIPLLPG